MTSGHQRLLRRNAIANMTQMAVTGLLLLVLYRFVNSTLGVDQLGVWSVVLATVSASRLAELGLSAGVVRFVARDLARGDSERAVRVVDTAALSLAVMVGVALPILLPLIRLVMPLVFDANYVTDALELLPYALASLWFTVVGTVFQSGLNGCERMDLRAGLMTTAQGLMVFLAVLLVPEYGLVGLALAQIGQGAFVLLVGRWLLSRVLTGIRYVPTGWRWPVLREMLGYGANLQAATVAIMLFDPVAKALMARFGGATSAGYFEMANQAVLKVRSLVVSANQAVIPHVAGLAEKGSEAIGAFYTKNVRLLVYGVLPLAGGLLALAGVVSWLFMGTFDAEFIQVYSVVAVAWCLNIVASAAYFSNMGSGQVGWNTVSHFIMSILNVGLGWALGTALGTMGVVLGYGVALVAGSAFLVVEFQRRYQIEWSIWRLRESMLLAAASVVAVVVGIWSPLRLGSPNFRASALVVTGLALAALAFAAWRHPARSVLLHSVTPLDRSS